MTETLSITHHTTPTGGEYRAIVPGAEAIGRMTWRQVGQGGQDVRLVDHTIVPPEIGGQQPNGQTWRGSPRPLRHPPLYHPFVPEAVKNRWIISILLIFQGRLWCC